MAIGKIGSVFKSVEVLFSVGTAAGLTDVQLLERFAGQADGGAEAAFAALVKRHGPLVLRVCRGELNDLHAAEDAFQATFLILARKARSIRKGGSLASWLFGVARRVARRARADRVRRAAGERRGALMNMSGKPTFVSPEPPELVPEIQEEVDRLPEKYRAPIILCYLEGLTHEEAASQLRVPVGTVKVRLSRGRERLRGRLVRRGLAPGAIAAALSASARAAVPVPLLEITVRAAMRVAVIPAAGVSAAVAILVEGALRAMFLSKLRTIAALAATSMTLAATSLLVVSALSRPVRSDQEPDPPRPQEVQKPTPTQPKPKPDQPDLGKTLTVKKSVFHRTTRQAATVQAFQVFGLYSKVSGELSELNVDIGDVVKKDQVLATIDSPELRYESDKASTMVRQAQTRVNMSKSKVQEAEAAIQVVFAQIAAARAEVKETEGTRDYREKVLKRMKDLVAAHAVDERLAQEEEGRFRAAQAATLAAKVKVDLEEAGRGSAEAKLISARYALEETKEDLLLAKAASDKVKTALQFCTIRSPIDGVVTRRGSHVGEVVQAAPSGGAVPLLTIVQANKVRVVVQIPDPDAAYLDKGDPVTFWVNGFPDRKFEGTISRTGFVEEHGTVRAEIDLDNADGRLRPGQAGNVMVVLEKIPDVIGIPSTAYFGVNDGNGQRFNCYRMVEGRPILTPITTSRYDPILDQHEVLDGLKEGDVIVPDLKVFGKRHEPARVQ